jgi:uncharacterized protein YbcI
MHTETFSRTSTGQRAEPSRNGNGRDVHSLQQPAIRTQGEIEAQVCEVIRRYSLEYIGRGPKDVHAYLIGDLLVVRMTGVLTVAEQHLVATSAEKGRLLLKQVRSQLIEAARNELESMIRVCTLVNVISLHHDISTSTGEEIIVFTLDDSPATRQAKRK